MREMIVGSHPLPALAPPPGVIPNFENPESLRKWWILMICMCLTFSTIFILLRLYTKLFLIKSHAWEDYFAYMAYLGLVGYLCVDFVAFSHGAGIHQWNVPRENIPTFSKAVHAKEVAYAPVIYFTRLSILLQFLRIFVPRRSGWAFYCIHALIWLNLIYYVLYFFTTLFLCVPQRKMWMPDIPGRCFSLAAVVVSAAFINVVSDVLMFLIPLFCISTLKMPTSRKVGIAAVFAVGLFVCITSIMRTLPSFHIIGAKDLTWDLIPLAFWADAEITSGIICGCMPLLPAFYRHIIHQVKLRSDSSGVGGPRSTEYQTSRKYRFQRSKELTPTDSQPSTNNSNNNNSNSKNNSRNVVAPWEDYGDSIDPCVLRGRYMELEDKGVLPEGRFGGGGVGDDSAATAVSHRETMKSKEKDIADESLVRKIHRGGLDSELDLEKGI